MQAIIVKYVGPTETKQSRMVAKAGGGCRKSVPFDHGLDVGGNYRAAAKALMTELGWGGRWAEGTLGEDRVFVWVDRAGGAGPLIGSEVAS